MLCLRIFKVKFNKIINFLFLFFAGLLNDRVVPCRFAADVKEMTGQTLSIYWSITLKFLAPAVIVLVLAASIAVRAMKGINYSAYDINTVGLCLSEQSN